MILLLLLLTIVVMILSLNHGIKKRQEQQSNEELDKSLSVLDEELSRLNKPKPYRHHPTSEEKERVLSHQRNQGIISFDEYLRQSLNEYPDNRDEFNRKP